MLASKIKSQPTIAYFILAFLISWTLWFLAPIVGGNGNAIYALIVFLGACGPVTAAFIVASTLNHNPSNAPKNKRLIAFAAAFAATFVIQPLVALFVTHSFTPLILLTSIVYSAVAGYIVSSVYHPNQGIATVMAGLKRVSLKNVWVWVAVLLPFVWQFIGGAIDLSLGGAGFPTLSVSSVLLVLADYPFTFFFGGPLTEEPGWRGFATPRLEQKYSPLSAGLIIGVIWSCWHFPLYVTPLYGGGLIPFLFRFVYNVPFGVLFTWLYNRSSGNLFATMLFHTSINTSNDLFGPNAELFAILLIIVTATIVAVHDKMRRKGANPLEQQMVKEPDEKASLKPQSNAAKPLNLRQAPAASPLFPIISNLNQAAR